MTVQVDKPTSVARLRRKNQLTLPEAIARELGVSEGDRFRVTVEDGAVLLTPLRRSYAGSLKGMWPDNWMEELRKERDEWELREIW